MVRGNCRYANNNGMVTWCGVDEQRCNIQSWQHMRGACAELGYAAMKTWFGVNGQRWEMQPW